MRFLSKTSDLWFVGETLTCDWDVNDFVINCFGLHWLNLLWFNYWSLSTPTANVDCLLSKIFSRGNSSSFSLRLVFLSRSSLREFRFSYLPKIEATFLNICKWIRSMVMTKNHFEDVLSNYCYLFNLFHICWVSDSRSSYSSALLNSPLMWDKRTWSEQEHYTKYQVNPGSVSYTSDHSDYRLLLSNFSENHGAY